MVNVRTLLCVFATAVCALGATISVEPLNSTVDPGQTFLVSVNASSIADLYAFQFDLGFDPGVLSAISVAEGTFLANGGSTIFAPGSIDNVNGAITFTAGTLVGALGGVSGSGALATIQFQAVGVGFSPVALSNLMLLDSGFGDIAGETRDGSVNVVPEPSTSFFFLAIIPMLVFSRYAKARRRRGC